MEQEQALRTWFDAWLQKDDTAISELFAPDIVYTECYGPQYHGLTQLRQWFTDWNSRGTVREWTIRRLFGQGRTLGAEWFFAYEFDGTSGSFDGVSVVDFDDEGRIARLSEYRSQAEHTHPYGGA